MGPPGTVSVVLNSPPLLTPYRVTATRLPVARGQPACSASRRSRSARRCADNCGKKGFSAVRLRGEKPTTGGKRTSFGQEYYQRVFGLDDMRRFNMHWWSVRFYALLSAACCTGAEDAGCSMWVCAHGYTLAWLERDFETVGIDISESTPSSVPGNTPPKQSVFRGHRRGTSRRTCPAVDSI